MTGNGLSSDYLRVIVDGPGTGAWNMGVDEALLEGGLAPVAMTLRFYRWCRPTVSLGYAQPLGGGLDTGVAAHLGVDVVRRVTGGRAVLHRDELTYSFVGPANRGPLAGGVLRSYACLADGLCTGLRRLGARVELERGISRPSGTLVRGEASGPGAELAACFSTRSRYEVLCAGRKLIGSAQRRRDGRLLQHGSMLLGTPDNRLWRALGGDGADTAGAVGLVEVLGRRPSERRLIWSLAEAIAALFGVPPRRGALTGAEHRRASWLAQRYRNHSWTARR